MGVERYDENGELKYKVMTTEQGKVIVTDNTGENIVTFDSEGKITYVKPSLSPDMQKDIASDFQDIKSAGGKVMESIYAFTDSIKDYPALSKLFGLPQALIPEWDKAFAPLLGSNWFPSAICERSYDIEPEGKAMIKTISGTYQAVASIQMERS
ncbi:hypothetical protein HZC32_00515 [Candidatus Woesearchaeota archaeon]|nr:hypothetical protein [Candidatus Woesearchaeota archaeon]